MKRFVKISVKDENAKVKSAKYLAVLGKYFIK